MSTKRRHHLAAVGAALTAGALLGCGTASATSPMIADATTTPYAYGPYTESQCHTVLLGNPNLQQAKQRNPHLRMACVSTDGGRTWKLYTDVALPH